MIREFYNNRPDIVVSAVVRGRLNVGVRTGISQVADDMWTANEVCVAGNVGLDDLLERLMDEGVLLELGDDEVMGIVDVFGAGVDGVRAMRKAQVLAYDKSSAVNEFTLNGYRMWLDRDERSGLRNRINAELSAGVEMTTVWHGTRHVTVPIGFADARLRELEMYAAGVFDVTHRHLAELDGLKNIGELMAYDISEGYPEKLVMSTGDNGLKD